MSNPPLRDQINQVGANICYTIYSCSMGKKQKLKFKDLLLKYETEIKTQEQILAESFARFEKKNIKNFRIKNG